MDKSLIGKFFKYLGKNQNTPVIAVCLIAFFKGIFRPMFTLMDKKQDPETKKYAAFREGLTEVAALPIYAIMPFLAAGLAEKVASNMKKNVNMDNIKGTAKFLGVCLATLLIPAVCNVIQPPIMNAYKKHEDDKKAKIANISNINTVTQPLQTPFNSSHSYGMKVGW